MTRFVPALFTLVALTSCAPPPNQAQMKGPQAVGVSPDAPRTLLASCSAGRLTRP